MEHFHGKFCKVCEKDVADFGGKALYLRHENGLEVLHLSCKDEENLFAFVFRTPVMDDKGKPHIMEHSVLCGSKKYPLKEPFVNLMNQSVNTFLNAMTYPDMTVYPAASVNSKDYYNLMSVYGDAVFFPLLTKDAFMQEAHRLEGEGKEFSLQGVVYNEMKGAYSSSYSVASDVQMSAMMQKSCYSYNSGGDPLEIPSLTYEEFVAFHKDYYTPSNCLLFLYGNEDTKKQLDFVQSELLDRLQEDNSRAEGNNGFLMNMMNMMKPSPIEEPIKVAADGPASDATGATVTLNWKVTHSGGKRTLDDTIKAAFLFQLLAGNDTSPVAKALNEASFGDNVMCSINTSASELMIYFGMSGVKRGKEEAVKSLVENTLKDVQKKGFDRGQIEAAVMAMDFSVREKKRSSDGPFSLILMESAASSWVYGNNPVCFLDRIKALNSFEDKMRKSKDESAFCVALLEEMILNNKECAYVTVAPKASYSHNREKKEKQIVRALIKDTDKAALKKRLDALHKAQERQESEKETSCIPSLRVCDLSNKLPPITGELSFIDGIPIIASQTDTNGIVYFQIQMPVDTLRAEDLPFLSLLGDCALLTGADGMKWDECVQKMAECTGGFVATPLNGTLYESDSAKEYLESVKQYNFTGRDWMVFSFKFPIEKMTEALPLFLRLLPRLDFDDDKRVKTIITQSIDNMRTSIIPYGSKMAAMRSRCRLSRDAALDEVWNGISQYFALNKIIKRPVKETGKRLTDILHRIIKSGCLINITADSKSLPSVIKMLCKKDNSGNGMLDGFCAITERPVIKSEDIYRLTLLDGESAETNKVAYTIKSQVGFAAACFCTGKMDYERTAASVALSRWMNSNVLWQTIRTKGGAYGASFGLADVTGIATFCTYRDPDPYRSLSVVRECLSQAAEMRFSPSDVEHLITGCYSEYVEPLSPSRYGAQALIGMLYGKTNEDRNKLLDSLLAITAETLHNEAARLLNAFDDGCVSSVICGKASSSCLEVDLSL